jgi:hypothetical protein
MYYWDMETSTPHQVPADQKLGDALTALLHGVAVSDPDCRCTAEGHHTDGKACC